MTPPTTDRTCDDCGAPANWSPQGVFCYCGWHEIPDLETHHEYRTEKRDNGD